MILIIGYNGVSCSRGLMDKALASGASNLGSSPSGDTLVKTRGNYVN